MVYTTQRLAQGHRFLVCFGPLVLSFSKITGIGGEIEVTLINEGGNNNGPVALYSPAKTAGKLVFEHGVGILNPINVGFEAARLGYYFSMPGVIVAYDGSGPTRAYAFAKAVPVKWSLSDFDAQSGEVLIDTVEITHNGIYEFPI